MAKKSKRKAIKYKGKTRIVRAGSAAEKKYLSLGGTAIEGTAGDTAVKERSSYLKSLNDPSSPNYRDTTQADADAALAAQTGGKVVTLPNGQQLTGEAAQAYGETTSVADYPGSEVATLPGQTTPTPQAPITPPALTTPGATVAPAPTATPSPYMSGFETATATGAPAPATAGEARTAVAGFIPPTPEVDPIDTQLQQDPYFSSLMTAFNDFYAPENQAVSLQEEYDNLVESSGLEALNTEAMNTKNIIEGTEDDIRNEITSTGGMATDSQVLALTNARNKTLIQNYNNLLDTIQSKEEYVNNAMQFAAQDRAAANQRFDSMFNMGMKMMEYRDKMKANATSGYDKILSTLGYNGLLKSVGGNAYEIGLIEKTMGLPAGSLKRLASEESRQMYASKGGSGAEIISTGNIPAGEELSYANVKPDDINLTKLVKQYSDFLGQNTALSLMKPANRALRNNLVSQITAEYKQAKKLGTLDAGVQKLMDGLLGRGGFANLSTKSQLKAVSSFLSSLGYVSPLDAPDGSGDQIIITD